MRIREVGVIGSMTLSGPLPKNSRRLAKSSLVIGVKMECISSPVRVGLLSLQDTRIIRI